MRTLIALLAISLIAVLVVQIWRSSRRPSTRGLDRFPEPPKELSGPGGAAVLPAVEGVYLGTSMAGDWRDRVKVGDIGQRSTAMLYLSGSGLLIDRITATPLWIPATAVRGARTGRVLASRPAGGADLFVTWQLGGRLLDSAFRADDGKVYPEWLTALRSIAKGSNGAAA
jgi:hypothetical protein